MSGLYTISALSRPLQGRVRIHAEGEDKIFLDMLELEEGMCVRTGTRFYLSTKGKGDYKIQVKFDHPFPTVDIYESLSEEKLKFALPFRVREEWGDQPFSLGLRLETESRGPA